MLKGEKKGRFPDAKFLAEKKKNLKGSKVGRLRPKMKKVGGEMTNKIASSWEIG
jgi:hypothetical protein